MGFKWIVDGVRVPTPMEISSTQRQVEKVQQIQKDRRLPGSGEEDSSNPKEQIVQRVAEKTYQQSKNMPQERRPAIHARQIMTSPVVTLSLENSLEDAWKLIRNRRFRHVPVLSNEKRIVGIISDRDLLREAAGVGIDTPNTTEKRRERKTITHFIKTKVLTASPETEIREIARTMFEERIGSMPVVDESGDLVGIITRSDILRTIINLAPLDLWI